MCLHICTWLFPSKYHCICAICVYICECAKNTVQLKKSWGLFVQYYFHVHLLYGCWQTTKMIWECDCIIVIVTTILLLEALMVASMTASKATFGKKTLLIHFKHELKQVIVGRCGIVMSAGNTLSSKSIMVLFMGWGIPIYLVYQHIYRAYNGWSLYLQWHSISSYVINSHTADNTIIPSNL